MWGIGDAHGIDQARGSSISAEHNSWISSLDRTQSGMRRGASVHCVSPYAAERALVSYRGSLDTSVCRVMWTLLGLGFGSSLSGWGVVSLG